MVMEDGTKTLPSPWPSSALALVVGGQDEGDGGRGHHADGDKGCGERTSRFYPVLQRYVLQPFHLMPHRFMLLK
ncbi:hypothetical protein [Bifidobacterium angulatum]|uniref:hypothetical protein n=1 Tax=Bifidobacterium angulatum TaxID=1683 RepID=UPI003AB2A5E5